MKLYVVTHKAVNNIPADRTLIGVGPNKKIENVDLYDNNGENISDKNSSYCELTALYWMWKNSDSDYCGLEHYRRFFCEKKSFPIIKYFTKVKVLPKTKIEKIMENYDVVLPKRIHMVRSMYKIYSKEHYKSDIDICVDIIKNSHPEYLNACKKVLKSHRSSMRNMFVMSKALLDEYCQWLFDILFQAESRIDLKDRNAYQSRVFGFLSERLFNVWLYHKNLKAYYAPIYDIGARPFFSKMGGAIRRIKGLFKKNK